MCDIFVSREQGDRLGFRKRGEGARGSSADRAQIGSIT
jgi:hypothetical protein